MHEWSIKYIMYGIITVSRNVFNPTFDTCFVSDGLCVVVSREDNILRKMLGDNQPVPIIMLYLVINDWICIFIINVRKTGRIRLG